MAISRDSSGQLSGQLDIMTCLITAPRYAGVFQISNVARPRKVLPGTKLTIDGEGSYRRRGRPLMTKAGWQSAIPGCSREVTDRDYWLNATTLTSVGIKL